MGFGSITSDSGSSASTLAPYVAVCERPWDRRQCLSDNEWDLQWRLNFGGLTDQIRSALDRVEGNCFGRRGKVMESASAEAIRDLCPSGVISTSMQPGPEFHPPNHVQRCHDRGERPDAWRRADVAVEAVNCRRMVIDVVVT